MATSNAANSDQTSLVQQIEDSVIVANAREFQEFVQGRFRVDA